MSAMDPKRQSDEPLSEAELAELEGLEGEATDAPWWYDEDDRYYRLHGTAGWTPEQGRGEFKIPAQPVNHQILKAAKQSDIFMPYWPPPVDARMIPLMRNALPRLLKELRGLRELARWCTCSPPGDWREEGPQQPDEDCPQHGMGAASRTALAEAQQENERLRARLTALGSWLSQAPRTEQLGDLPYCQRHDAWHLGSCEEWDVWLRRADG